MSSFLKYNLTKAISDFNQLQSLSTCTGLLILPQKELLFFLNSHIWSTPNFFFKQKPQVGRLCFYKSERDLCYVYFVQETKIYTWPNSILRYEHLNYYTYLRDLFPAQYWPCGSLNFPTIISLHSGQYKRLFYCPPKHFPTPMICWRQLISYDK